MISFYYNLMTLARTFVAGFRNNPEFQTIAILLVFLLLGGAVFFARCRDGPCSTHFTFA